MDLGSRKIYQDSTFYQRIFLRSGEVEIQSVAGGVVATIAPHGFSTGNRAVLAFSGPRGQVFETIATRISDTEFSVPDTLPTVFTRALAIHPIAVSGTLEARIYSYPDKPQALDGRITCNDNSNVAIISESTDFTFVEGMTLSAPGAFTNAVITDWHTTKTVDCGCEVEYEHKLVLATASNAALSNSFDFSINGEDSRDAAQTELEYTHTTFTGTQLYGEVEFTIPRAEINALKRSDHLLQVLLSDGLLYRVTLTFDGPDTLSDLEIGDNTHSIELLGGNTIGTAPGVPATLIKINQAVTIPASGGVTVVVDPVDSFASGQSENVVIRQIAGVLSRAGAVYTFTRSSAGSAVSVAVGTLISVIGSSFVQGLDPESRGLTVNSGQLGLLPTGPDIDLHSREIFTERSRPSPPNTAASADLTGRTIVDAIITQNNRVLAALLADERFWFSEIETKYIRRLEPNQLGLVHGVQSLDNKILFGVRGDGWIYCQGIIGASIGGSSAIADSEGTIYKTVNGQIVAESGVFSRQLTTLGNNSLSSLSPDDSKIYFSGDRDGAAKNYWMDRDGSNQFYAGLIPYLFSNKIFHVIWTGQSLSEGATSTAQSVVQNYANLKFNGGVKPGSTAGNLASFVPLTENNFERGTVAFTDLLSQYARSVAIGNQDPGGNDNVFLCTAVGVGARMLRDIKKNPFGAAPEPSYADSIAQVQAGFTLATGLGKGFEVPFIVFHHGESDDATAVQNQVPSYKELLVIFWQEYNADIKAITSQGRDVKILMTQTSAWTDAGRTTPNSAIDQYEVWEENPDKYSLVCAKYHIPTFDGTHLFASGYQIINEMCAIAASFEAHQNKPWKPVYPVSITRVGAVVTINFHVPVWPLIFDTVEVTNPGNFGFEYFNTSNAPVTINSVVMGVDKKSVILTLASATAGFAAYAYTGISGNFSGPTTGARGNLRDSALYPSGYGHTLRNWCVHFYKAVS